MAIREGLTGTRIRERRTISGIKQADLARRVGISASYLNLIEHNRRRIGGKLLLDIAAVLKVEPQVILEGAEAALIAGLREAAEAAGIDTSEAEKAEEFAGRFPGWADALSEAHRRITALERTVETLSDRMAHDPQLAASLHEVLSTAAAIRSTASILEETSDLDAVMQTRFHANIHQDSQRLSESAKILVEFLEADPQDTGARTSAQEDVDNWLAAAGYSFAQLERGERSASQIVDEAPLTSAASRHLATSVLTQMASDAQHVKLGRLEEAVEQGGFDPAGLAARFQVPVSMILRRLAVSQSQNTGLVVVDRAGSLVFRKPVDGFSTPRFGAACTLWPIFEVLNQPGLLLRDYVLQLGQARTIFEIYAISEPVTACLLYTSPSPRDS